MIFNLTFTKNKNKFQSEFHGNIDSNAFRIRNQVNFISDEMVNTREKKNVGTLSTYI